MSELRLSALVGRPVHDADGAYVGRVQDMRAVVRLHALGNDYEVIEFSVGGSRLVESLVGGRFVQPMLRALGRHLGERRLLVPWDTMDLSDPDRPRLTRRRAELAEPR